MSEELLKRVCVKCHKVRSLRIMTGLCSDCATEWEEKSEQLFADWISLGKRDQAPLSKVYGTIAGSAKESKKLGKESIYGCYFN